MEKNNLRRSVFLLMIFLTGFTFVKSQSPKMISVEGGTFTMGNSYTENDKKGDVDEKPAHEVTLSSFYICEHELTVGEYQLFCKATGKKMPEPPNQEWMESHTDTKKFYPSAAKSWWGWDKQFPMHYVTWEDAIEYCNWLSEKEGLEKCYTKNSDFGWDTNLKKNGYRLPTEAEWEYAARGGNKSKNYRFSGSNNVADVGCIDITTGQKGPCKIKSKKPNELGIYDMCGNVWEWCSDYYSSNYYGKSPKKNPFFSVSQPYRVLRGGSWHYQEAYATVTSRDGPEPGFTNYNYGFRLAKSK